MAPKTTLKKNLAAAKPKPLCRNPPRPVPQISTAVSADPNRQSAIFNTQLKWVNGTVLHYCFFTSRKYSVPKVQADAVRDAFAKWKAVGIGLEFVEVKKLAEAEVRIGYSVKIGASQSSVGRNV